jgi:hypothetical protein
VGFVFERQPKESEKAFAAFGVYLGLGPQRSLEAAGKRLGKSTALLERWSSKYDWPSRVRAHSAHMAVIERKAAEALARVKGVDWVIRQSEQREEEWKVRCELLETAREALKRWKDRPDRCGSLEGIARLLELASKLGRLASGMATDKTEVTGEDGGPIRVELELALKKVYGGAVEAEVVEVEAAKVEGCKVRVAGSVEGRKQKGDQRLLTSSPTGGGND